MADTISFKVFLTKEDDPIDAKPEVRRFGIDSDVVSSFVYLSEKLQSVFAPLRSRRFTISWKDTDGDDVVISSDEELKIALSETESHNVRVLHVILHSEYPSDNFTSDKEPITQTVHSGVICDACDKEIQGFRYKCIQCPDFDLCADCEGKGLHPEHCMIRSATPIQWKPHFGRRIAHHMNKFARKSGHASSGKEGESAECPQKRGKFHGGYHGGHHGGHHGESHGRYSERQSWLDTLTAYLNEWAHLPQEGGCPMRNHSTQQNNGDSETNKDKNGCGKEKPRVDIPAEFLKDIGQNLANLLDPLGINVQVTPESPNAPGTSSAENNTSQPDTTPQKFPGEGKKLVESPPPTSNPAPSAPVNGDSTHKLTMEHDGWTLLHRQENLLKPNVVNPTHFQIQPARPIKPPSFGFLPPPPVVSNSIFGPSPVSAPTSSGPDFSPISAPTSSGSDLPPTSVPTSSEFGPPPTSVPATIITANPIYPELPKQAEIEQLTYHPDPKIQRAIVAMMQMGFSNDGGWLTHLLASKDGDISKVLDILQPVRLH